jgi:hypothetical protein
MVWHAMAHIPNCLVVHTDLPDFIMCSQTNVRSRIQLCTRLCHYAKVPPSWFHLHVASTNRVQTPIFFFSLLRFSRVFFVALIHCTGIETTTGLISVLVTSRHCLSLSDYCRVSKVHHHL